MHPPDLNEQKKRMPKRTEKKSRSGFPAKVRAKAALRTREARTYASIYMDKKRVKKCNDNKIEKKMFKGWKVSACYEPC